MSNKQFLRQNYQTFKHFKELNLFLGLFFYLNQTKIIYFIFHKKFHRLIQQDLS